MKHTGMAKHFLLAFLLAAIGYTIAYQVIEHRRVRNGPWQVTFTQATSGVPAIVIDQTRLAVTNVWIAFADRPALSTNSPQIMVFSQPRPVPYDVPYGQCVFMDSTFLPGTLTFRLFGHEIELLPRVLIVDHQEHPWLSDSTITLHPKITTNSPP